MHLKSLFLFVFLLCTLISCDIQQEETIELTCSTPCNPPNQCYDSVCDTTQGVCVTTIKQSLPVDCCNTVDDCRTGECVIASCTTDSICEYTQVCANPSINITQKACVNSNQCQGDNVCYQSKCIDNICVNSPLANPDADQCCYSATDCPDSECSSKYCDVNTYTCLYIPIPGCIVNFSIPTIITTGYYSSSSSSSSLSSNAELYIIPDSYGAGDIVFLIIGCVVLFAVVLIFIYIVLSTLYEIIHERFGPEQQSDLKEAPAGH